MQEAKTRYRLSSFTITTILICISTPAGAQTPSVSAPYAPPGQLVDIGGGEAAHKPKLSLRAQRSNLPATYSGREIASSPDASQMRK